jgi:A/G-specific adenine glycosylase
MHFAAKQVMVEFNGIFPDNYKDILSLKGVGPYTAAAIASFAFGEKKPVVDGNVIRVISRYFGIEEDVSNANTIKYIYKLAEELIENVDPAIHNQMMMDFGAIQCLPKSPICMNCPLELNCVAYKSGKISIIPKKDKKVKVKKRYFHYLDVREENGLILKKRDTDDIWAGLYDLLMIETANNEGLTQKTIINELSLLGLNFNHKSLLLDDVLESKKHILTHQIIYSKYYKIRIKGLEISNPSLNFVNQKKVHNFAVSKLLEKYLNKLL